MLYKFESILYNGFKFKNKYKYKYKNKYKHKYKCKNKNNCSAIDKINYDTVEPPQTGMHGGQVLYQY